MPQRPDRLGRLLPAALALLMGLAGVALPVPASAQSGYELLLSSSPDRSDPVALEGRTVSGEIYVFVGPETGISRVDFFLDDPEMVGEPIKVERRAPWDLGGTDKTTRAALPFDTTVLSDGPHLLTAVLHLSDRSTVIRSVGFEVADSAPRLVLQPDRVDLTVGLEESGVAQVALDTTDEMPAAFTATSDVAWLLVEPGEGITPSALTLSIGPDLDPGVHQGTVRVTAEGYPEAALPVSVRVVAGTTEVSISGTDWLLGNEVTHPGTPAEGLLLNARMIQAIFDDRNPETVGRWAYPDTGAWDPERNTEEFLEALPTYARHGLRAITVGLQGGDPIPEALQDDDDHHPWEVGAFAPDGSLDPAWLDRLDRVIRAADLEGMVVVVSYFYFGQDHRFIDEAAVLAATDAATEWLLAQGYPNVVVEVANESAPGKYDHPILRPDRIHELVARVQERSGGRLLVSASTPGCCLPPDALIRQADFVLLHGASDDRPTVERQLSELRSRAAYQAHPKPIVYNEDKVLAHFREAVERGASWGFHDPDRANNYRNGFQSPPVNWTINTPSKLAFFDLVAELTGSR